jgi:hypothetical protein
MEADGERAAAEAIGESVVVVPAVAAVLVGVAVGAHACEFGEGEVAGVGEFAEAERTAAGVEPQCSLFAVVSVPKTRSAAR